MDSLRSEEIYREQLAARDDEYCLDCDENPCICGDLVDECKAWEFDLGDYEWDQHQDQ